jgi:hypothetical protein
MLHLLSVSERQEREQMIGGQNLRCGNVSEPAGDWYCRWMDHS